MIGLYCVLYALFGVAVAVAFVAKVGPLAGGEEVAAFWVAALWPAVVVLAAIYYVSLSICDLARRIG